jgi:hypothetical protein
MGKYRGHAAIRHWFDQWLEVFPSSEVIVEDLETRLDLGLVTILQYATGGSSGVPTPFHYYGVGRWRDGRLVFVENYMDAEAARAAFEKHAQESAAEPTPSTADLQGIRPPRQ